MRIAAASLIPLALLPLASAGLATDAYKWANELVSSDVQSGKHGEVHTMDSWSYVDCGESPVSEPLMTRSLILIIIGLPTDVV